MRVIETGEGALRRLFAALVESVFQTDLGIADPRLTDYLADMLCRSLRLDALHEVRDPRGGRCEDLVALIEQAEREKANGRSDIWQQIGDVTLFWTGVYPEVRAWLRKKQRRDALLDLSAQGKRSYLLASRLQEEQPLAGAANGAGVLRRLSDEFDLCCNGLLRVRREWEAMAAGGL